VPEPKRDPESQDDKSAEQEEVQAFVSHWTELLREMNKLLAQEED
jgi:hypothetical protein